MSARVVRFNRTERWVHAVQAASFLILLATGIAISVSWVEGAIGHRALLRQIHLTTAFFFVFGPALVVLAGDWIAVKRDAQQIDRWPRDDVRWLTRPTVTPDALTPPSGRFNAGQKLNTIFTVYCTLAFGATGLILWQNRRFPSPLVTQANIVHEWLAYIALLVFLGHIFLSTVHPATRASFSGVLTGTVRADWAKHHHANWQPPQGPETPLRWPSVIRATGLLALGSAAAALISRIAFEAIGANVTDPVIKQLYAVTGLPGTLQHAATAQNQFDLGATIWLGVVVALWYGAMRRYALLPSAFPAPAKG